MLQCVVVVEVRGQRCDLLLIDQYDAVLRPEPLRDLSSLVRESG